ncbi:carbohydrate binding domain-containing protein [Thioalkalivibrio sp. XN279]|uniref:carbohydrate binding domain-containing protein n=1 Tax=Thioalkalivibrio sp. XN279 TaxID=2714953 RepID=UPI00140A9ABF|nr:carbohydrate binding domain-containing protein [Thioalkalivibrio sp. XN279]NHA14440.1 hypothetical protein [Thioalkalivibrio sp. XN279]
MKAMKVATGLALVALLLASPLGNAHKAESTSPEPGFRPEAPAEARFLADLGGATIAVYPTIIRRAERSAHSFKSQELVIAFLNEEGTGRAIAAHKRIDRGRMLPDSQWNIFQGGLATVAGQLAEAPVDAGYSLVLEILVPDDRVVFGIQCYVVNAAGENAFSFLLNEHHQMFAAAGLVAGESQAARDAMIENATRVAMQALKQQLARVEPCAGAAPTRIPTQPASDLIDGFETGLPSGFDPHGIPLGFSTFNGDRSRARISTTPDHPPVPGERPGNSVLKLELEVDTWAGVLHRFANETVDEWLGYDWSGALELSFWFHGNDSGTRLVIDVLDNRRLCSVLDDAERYSYEFADAFSGWRLMSIPLEIMARKEIWNGAPNDGLGLSAVHGWGIAALQTDGSITFFVDDVRLRREPLMKNVPAGLSREADIWVPVNELPMFGGYEKTAWQKTTDEKFLEMVLPGFQGDRAAAAEHFARTGWNFYYQDNKTVAIKRFNQAWMLDPGNQYALWGFAVISRERGKTEAALRFYRMALDAGPAQAGLKEEYESLRRQVAD